MDGFKKIRDAREETLASMRLEVKDELAKAFTDSYEHLISFIGKAYLKGFKFKYEQSADDILNEGYLSLLKTIDQTPHNKCKEYLSSESSIYITLLKRAIKFKFIDHFKSTKSRLEREREFSKLKESEVPPDSLLEEVDFFMQLEPEDKALARMLRDGKTVSSIRDSLGYTERQFYKKRNKLRETLEREMEDIHE